MAWPIGLGCAVRGGGPILMFRAAFSRSNAANRPLEHQEGRGGAFPGVGLPTVERVWLRRTIPEGQTPDWARSKTEQFAGQ